MNRAIYHVLLGGVLVAVVLIGVGYVLGAANPAGLTQVPLSLPEIAQELVHLTPAGFLALGVILMILTPVARVFLSIVAYVRDRDSFYIVITMIVFLNLLVGILLGLG